MFSYEIDEIFKNTFFYRTIPMAACEQTEEIFVVYYLILVGILSILILSVIVRLLNGQNLLSVTKVICRQSLSFLVFCFQVLPEIVVNLLKKNIFHFISFHVASSPHFLSTTFDLFDVHNHAHSSWGKVEEQTSCILKIFFSLAQVQIPKTNL